MVESPAPYDDVGKIRKSLPIWPAASVAATGMVYCPVGTFTPTVITAASLPSVQLARTCVSVSPLMELTELPLVETSELAYAVATSMLNFDPMGTTATSGMDSCVTVLADAPVPILMETYCGIAASVASPRPCACTVPAATASSRVGSANRVRRMVMAS